MAINFAELESAFVDNMLLLGKDKNVVLSMAPNAVRNGAKAFWRQHNWTFSRKYTTIPLPASQTTPVDLPNNCDGVLIARRLTTDDDGMTLSLLPEAVFDASFPNVAALSNGSVVAAKIYSDEGILKIQFAPPSDTTITVGIVYKMKYDETKFKNVVPSDFEPYVKAAVLYHAMPAGTMERQSMYSEYKDQMKEAKRGDKTSYTRAGQLVGGAASSVSRNSWRFWLDGTDYHGMY